MQQGTTQGSLGSWPIATAAGKDDMSDGTLAVRFRVQCSGFNALGFGFREFMLVYPGTFGSAVLII